MNETNPDFKNINNGRLPPDSLIQIWSKLPLKSVYKFRSVSKLWNFFISTDPLLSTLRHTTTATTTPQPPNLLLFLRHTATEPIKLPDRPLHLSARPIEDLLAHDRDPGSICIKNGFTPYVDHSLDLLPSKGPIICLASAGFFYLCNPSTQEFLKLPRGQGADPTTPAAFGYLPEQNVCVLVRMMGMSCEILEFGPGLAGSATWRIVGSEPPAPVRGFGLMVDGVFYWSAEVDSHSFVVCLDIKEERFGVVPRPQGNENEAILFDHLYLVEFKGSVCAVDNFSRPPRMEIWVLVKNGWEFQWVRKYNIFISGMGRDLVYPFCDYEGENGGEMVLCNATRSRLYCYNLKNRSIRQVYRPKNRTNDRLSLYTPGLFPLSIADCG